MPNKKKRIKYNVDNTKATLVNKYDDGGNTGNTYNMMGLTFTPADLLIAANATAATAAPMVYSAGSGGKSSKAGKAINAVGNVVSAAPLVGGMAALPIQALGALTNAAFGSKLNKENIANVQSNINSLNNFQSSASSFDDLLNTAASQPTATAFTRKDIGSDGWFSDKAKNKYNKLVEAQNAATEFVNNSLENNLNNLSNQQKQNALASYYADGGDLYILPYHYEPPSFFGMTNKEAEGGKIYINPANKGKFSEAAKRAGMGTQEYASHILANKDDYSPLQVKRANFAKSASKWHAFGGDLATNGADFSNGYTYIGNGGRHETNPYEGVQIGVDPQGVPNLVEEGEVVHDGYVFSNRLTVPDDIKNKYKLGKKEISFADAFKKLTKESDERPNDPISKKGLDAMAEQLMMSQETVRQAEQDKKLRKQFNSLSTGEKEAVMQAAVDQQAQQALQSQALQEQAMAQQAQEQVPEEQMGLEQYAHGGRLGTWFDGPGDSSNNLYNWDWENMFNWNTYPGSDSTNPFKYIVKSQVNELDPHTIFPKTLEQDYLDSQAIKEARAYLNAQPAKNAEAEKTLKNAAKKVEYDMRYGDEGTIKDLPTWMRYIPAFGAGIGYLQNVLSKPDYSNATRIENATNSAGNYERVRATPLGNYLTYNPLDRQYEINLLNAQSGATRRNILNTSAGNRGQAMAGLLAADYNAGNQLGALFRNAEESNRAERERVATFNRATDQYNSESALRAAMANQSARQQAVSQSIQGIIAAANMREAIDQARATSMNANLTNLFDSLGDIGKENYSRNDFNRLLEAGYFGTLARKPQGWSNKRWLAYQKGFR